MEGLIPFVYRAIVQYKNGKEEHHVLASWFNDSPSASYTRLPTGDSGRFQMSDERPEFNLPPSVVCPLAVEAMKKKNIASGMSEYFHVISVWENQREKHMLEDVLKGVGRPKGWPYADCVL
ncbi:hypothetical protein F3Y22_tig00110833pilonHSYRG00062 [Hibiscus syriacus]|uniref:Uncharacterized protein n=1 Tax=Hibiscus syriacus TaxID=106335 RepID=A0A6A2ZKF3_HIBSY|nr:hypothetical protein F3Y22_tig00110833pilonHSYRG00062 [Hibiscus syriacus]